MLKKIYLSAWAAITKYHRPGGLNNRTLFSYSSGSFKSKIKVLAGLVSSGTSFPGFKMAVFPLCPYMVISLCLSVS